MRHGARPTSVRVRSATQPPAFALPVVDLARQYQAIAVEIMPIL
jgi:hypothetical protein